MLFRPFIQNRQKKWLQLIAIRSEYSLSKIFAYYRLSISFSIAAKIDSIVPIP